MKAKITGMSTWQGTPTSGTLTVYPDGRYEDGDGNATVGRLDYVLDVDSKTWRSAHNPATDAYIVVSGPGAPFPITAMFEETFSYAGRSDVKQYFRRNLVASDLDATEFNYIEPQNVRAYNGAEPLTMQAARQLLVTGAAQVGEVAQALTQTQAQQAATDNAIAAVYLAQSTSLAGSVGSYAELPAAATEGQAYIVRNGLQVYARTATGWSYQRRLGDTALAVGNSGRTSDALADKLRLPQINLPRRTTINRVRMFIAARHTDAEATTSKTNLMRIIGRTSLGAALITGPLVEIPEPGWHEFPIPSITLDGAPCFFGPSTNNVTSAKFGRADYAGGIEVPHVWPAPSTVSTATPTASVPHVQLLPADPPRLISGGVYRQLGLIVYGKDVSSGQPCGNRFGRLVRTPDAGLTFVDLGPWPTFATGESAIDLLVVPTKDKAWVLGNRGTLWQLNGLSGTGTYVDKTPPDRHPNAAGRPYGIEYMTWTTGGAPYLYALEYSNAPNEINGELTGRWPAVHELDIDAQNWQVSAFFPNVRHMHSFIARLNNALYVTAGDALRPSATPGVSVPATGVGLYRLTASGRGTGTGGAADTWVKVSAGEADGYSSDYPVDGLYLTGRTDRPDGLYFASDRPGSHILRVKVSGSLGRFNVNTQCYGLNGSLSETVRSLTHDPATGNLLYYTSETTEPGLYASPPPHTQTLKLKPFDLQPSIMRGVVHAGHFMQHIHALSVPVFEGQ